MAMLPLVFSPIVPALLVAWHGMALAQPQGESRDVRVADAVQRFSSSSGERPPLPWRAIGLPGGKVPLTGMDLVVVDSERVLRLASASSYGTLSHAVLRPADAPGRLRWRWRVDQHVAGADLRRKDADDAAVKVCAMFDLPLEALGFWERQLMRVARSRSAEPLPAATICYVWDNTLPAGTHLPNAYTARVRFVVLDSGPGAPGEWRRHDRDLAADFRRAFGHEAPQGAPLVAVVIGADSDNTGSKSLAYVGDVSLEPAETRQPSR